MENENFPNVKGKRSRGFLIFFIFRIAPQDKHSFQDYCFNEVAKKKGSGPELSRQPVVQSSFSQAKT